MQVRPSPPPPSPPPLLGSPSNWCGVVVPALSCTVPPPPPLVGWCGVVVPAARPLLQQQRHQRHHHHHHHHDHDHHQWLVLPNPVYCGVLLPPPLWCGVAAPHPCPALWCGVVVPARPLLQQQRQYPQVGSLHCHQDRLCLTVDGFGAAMWEKRQVLPQGAG